MEILRPLRMTCMALWQSGGLRPKLLSDVLEERHFEEDEEEEDKTETESSDQQYLTSRKDLWPLGQSTSGEVLGHIGAILPLPDCLLGERSSDVQERMESSLKVSCSDKEPSQQLVATVEKTVTKELLLPLCQVSSKTMEFERGEGPSACEPRAAEMSLSNFLSERIVLLVKYLDRIMVNTRCQHLWRDLM
ncbi:hypothetical protein AXG93_4855s1010 [Marchantia polymorpha subsp. ruderalis]|uniref:Uncharacterized protein n=1 Tax=Marchantia polymorpha subsp. ruderalis TaxID=1480154 RepID=A0A176VNM4_MARPO|nr:hypothetical protein AXG93_4855s1010 [Marchantia polymorpha subsp. ruderalis]